jgi:small subunit ribosomal protein S15
MASTLPWPLTIKYLNMLDKDKKLKVIKKFQTHEGDTGSTEVQIAILSEEIKELADHLKLHHKDHSSRRGLLRKVGERRRLLRYLKKENAKSYEELTKKLKIKQAKTLVKPGTTADQVIEEVKDEDVDANEE